MTNHAPNEFITLQQFFLTSRVVHLTVVIETLVVGVVALLSCLVITFTYFGLLHFLRIWDDGVNSCKACLTRRTHIGVLRSFFYAV